MVALALLAAAAGIASATSGPLRATAYKEALAGESATRILGQAFPAGKVTRITPRKIRVLVGAAQTWVIVEGQTTMTLSDGGTPKAATQTIPAHDQVKLTPVVSDGAVTGISVTNLDAATPAAVTMTGPVRISSTTSLWMDVPGLDQGLSPGLRFHGTLEVSAGFQNTLDVVNDVSIEDYVDGVLAGQIPSTWGPKATQAVIAGAIAVRSRAVASIKTSPTATYDVTTDAPLYLGIDGQRASTNAAAADSAGKVLTDKGKVMNVGFVGVSPIIFRPSPGHPDAVAAGKAKTIACDLSTSCASHHGNNLAAAALKLALSMKGHPYVYGGTSPGGFDCSGLMYWVWFKNLGFKIPRTAEDQSQVGYPVQRNDLQPGDLVFFSDSSGYVFHVGMYIGDDEFIAAANPALGVRIDSLTEPFYAESYAGARRFSPSPRA